MSGNGKKKICCALLCVACDIPRKEGMWVLAHNACFGCTSVDYSGFERDKWKLRMVSSTLRLQLIC